MSTPTCRILPRAPRVSQFCFPPHHFRKSKILSPPFPFFSVSILLSASNCFTLSCPATPGATASPPSCQCARGGLVLAAAKNAIAGEAAANIITPRAAVTHSSTEISGLNGRRSISNIQVHSRTRGQQQLSQGRTAIEDAGTMHQCHFASQDSCTRTPRTAVPVLITSFN